MAATFVVEDGTGKEDANAYCTVAVADQYNDNFVSSSSWDAVADSEKELAIRVATQYIDSYYSWQGYRAVEDQSLQWPRWDVFDGEGWAVDSNIVPIKVQYACSYLAIRYIEGDTLLPDLEDDYIKKTKNVVGPIQEEIEYFYSGTTETLFPIADALVDPYISTGDQYISDLERS